MNVCAAIAPTIPSHKQANAEVDAWRGRCVRHFAKVEQAIARFLAANDPQTPAIGHGLGCRLKQFAAFLNKAPPATKSLGKSLRDMETNKAIREAIVHGDGTVYLSDQGAWLWDCEYLNARDPNPHRKTFRMVEAAKIEADLERWVRSLCDGLDHYRPK